MVEGEARRVHRAAAHSSGALRLAAGILALLLAGCFIPDPPARRAPVVLTGAALGSALPQQHADLAAEGRHWFWGEADGPRFEVLRALPDQWIELSTPQGPLRARWELLAEGDAQAPRVLPRLLENAGREGLTLADFTLRGDPLVGPHLTGNAIRVLPEGVLRAQPEPLPARSSAERAHARARLEKAVAEVDAALEGTALSPSARDALRVILGQLGEGESEASFESIQPAFARRLVRGGWPRGLGLPEALLAELRGAIVDVETLRPDERFAGSAGSWVYARDALGEGVWLLATSERSGYARAAAEPAYFYDVVPAKLAVRLPAGADPLADAERWTEAALFAGFGRLARFDDASGLEVDPVRWRRAHPLGGPSADPGQIPDALPPHIVVLGPGGDVLALATAHGLLRPAQSGEPGEAERFYREAARVLPDAAHLDLIGQHLVVYTYDSPDPRHPDLLGTRQLAGDIHQTARQTLDTQAGGTYRGDCDDLSELYLEIARRQDRNAQMIGLPAHAALAWAERDPAGWRSFVLHTGQPRSFAAPTLHESLEQVYRSFGAGEVIDFTKLEVLLRFSDENTRQSWYLSERIFADPEYARAMIDVQHDWHLQTYQRAIEKMQRMIAAGDLDPANYSELSGLYHYTGRYAEAAEALEHAIAAADTGQTRVSLQVDRMLALYRAGRSQAARALAVELREQQIPALEQELGRALVDPRLSLADALLQPKGDAELALEILAQDVAPQLDAPIAVIAESLVHDAGIVQAWNDGAVDPLRYQLRWYVSSAINALYRTREGPLRDHPARAVLAESAGRWIDGVGFHDLDPTESVLARYAVVGRFYQALGTPRDLEARLLEAPPPMSTGIDHARRVSGPEQIERDLPWIAASPTYWAAELTELFAEDRPRAAAARVVALADRVDEARRRLRALGLDHAEFDAAERSADLLRALLARRPEALRRVLREVRASNDRQERLALATAIAAAARSLPLDWYGRVLDIFARELDYKPVYFWIAWNAALSGAEPQALLTAKLAAKRFPSDPAFAAEYAYMRRRFGAAAAAR